MAKPTDNNERSVVIYLGGTGVGNKRNPYNDIDARFDCDDGVVRIYINGCQDPNVGNSSINPNLERVVKRIQRAFSKSDEGAKLSLDILKQELKSGLHCIMVGDSNATSKTHGFRDDLILEEDERHGSRPQKLDLNKDLPDIEVDKIALMGFSRGAVTTLAVAKGLDDLDVPMYIVANQPVPGETSAKGTLLKKYQDCSKLKNLKKATTMLAQHDKTVGTLHDAFFKQMVPQYGEEVDHQVYVMPTQSHFETKQGAFTAAHIGLHMLEYGFVSSDKKKKLEQAVKTPYESNRYPYTPYSMQQSIYGVKDNREIPRHHYFEDYVSEQAKLYIESLRWEDGLWAEKNDQHHSFTVFNEHFEKLPSKEKYILSIFKNLMDVNNEQQCAQYKQYFKTLFLSEPPLPNLQRNLLIDAMIEVYELGRYYEAKIIKNNIEASVRPNFDDFDMPDKYQKALQRHEKTEALANMLKQHVKETTKQYISGIFEAQYAFLKDQENLHKHAAHKALYANLNKVGKEYSDAITQKKGFINRKALRISLDILTHITVVGMLANFVKKLLTGKWLISREKTNPENLSKKNIKHFKNSLEEVKHDDPTHSEHTAGVDEQDKSELDKKTANKDDDDSDHPHMH